VWDKLCAGVSGITAIRGGIRRQEVPVTIAVIFDFDITKYGIDFRSKTSDTLRRIDVRSGPSCFASRKSMPYFVHVEIEALTADGDGELLGGRIPLLIAVMPLTPAQSLSHTCSTDSRAR